MAFELPPPEIRAPQHELVICAQDPQCRAEHINDVLEGFVRALNSTEGAVLPSIAALHGSARLGSVRAMGNLITAP